MGKKRKMMLSLMALLASISLVSACGTLQDSSSGSNDESSSVGSEEVGSSTGGSENSSESSTPDPEDPVSLGAELLSSIPESSLKTTATAGEDTATANWFVKYGESKLEITAYVADTMVYTAGGLYNNDGIEVIIAKTQRLEGYSEGTLSVIVDVAGNIAIKNLYSNATVDNSGITAKAQTFTLENKQVDGYYITISVPYTATEVSYANKDAAICFGLNNASSLAKFQGVYDSTYGTNYENVNTYVYVSDDDTFAVNPYVYLGAVWGDANDKLQASDVWDIDNDNGATDASITSTGVDNKDNLIYMHSSNYLVFYAEVKINIKELLNNEHWGKFGLTMTSANGKNGFFYYVDAVASDGKKFDSGSVGLGINRGVSGSWADSWDAIGNAGGTSEQYTGDNYITLGIYRNKDSFGLYANGNLITTITSTIGAEEEAYLGLACFNMTMNVKDYFLLTDEAQIERALLKERSIKLGDYEGVSASFSTTKAKKGDTVTFTLDLGDKMLDTVSVNGTVLTADNGVYTFEMPDADVTVSLTFKGLRTVDISADIADMVSVSATTVYEGGEVTLKAIGTWAINKLYANGVEIVPTDGEYVLTVTENTTITGTFYYAVDGVVLDGTIDEAYGETYTLAEYTDNRNVKVYAVKTANGVFVYAVAHMNTTKTDANAWYLNTNMEIWLNAVQHYVNINGDLGNVTKAYWNTTPPQTDGGKYEYVVEAFIEKSLIKNWTDDGSVQLNYGWKTEGETGYAIGDVIHAYALDWNHDWLAGHSGGVNVGANDFATGFGTYGTYSDKLQITKSGLEVGKTAKDAIIDGDLTDAVYADKASVTVGDESRAQFVISGFAGSDGLYLTFTITHGNWSELTTGNWSANDNIELRINGGNLALLFLNGRLSVPDFFDQGAATTKEVDGKLVTTVELFAAGTARAYKLQVGCNGSGFSGWQALIWDGNVAYVTENGVKTDYTVQVPANLDGVLDDAVWTEEVLSKSFTTTVNGATFTMVGVNTKDGIMLGFTVVHSKATNTVIQSDGSAWWNYMGPEFRLGGNKNMQLAVTTWNNSTIGDLQFGYKTTENEGGTYTTTFEVFVSHGVICTSNDDKVTLSVGGVYETGFSWLFGCDNANPMHYVTANGIIAK